MKSKRRWVAISIAGAAIVAVGIQVAVILVNEAGKGVPVVTPRSTGATAPIVEFRTASGDFASIESGGEPPPNILEALSVPIGAQSTGTINLDKSAGGYDRGVDYESPIPSQELLNSYKGNLAGNGWTIIGTFTIPNSAGSEILAKLAGSDGNYWEVAISSPIARGNRPSDTRIPGTTFQLRLQQVNDES